jgi:alpha-L-fucosidase 2
MVAYQRHLLISAVREDSWPANLQGRWNGDYKPAWASDYHNNINIQMTYWPAPQTGLVHLLEPLADYFFQFLDDYRHNARQLFGCRGFSSPGAWEHTGRCAMARTRNGQLEPDGWRSTGGSTGW